MRLVIDRLNTAIGCALRWLTLLMVAVQVAIVLLRYVFGVGYVALQESMLYMNGALFLGAAGYVLLKDGHVRVDILYRDAGPRRKAWADAIGGVLFLMPVTVAVFVLSYPYVAQSWTMLERSREASGIPAVFALKSMILLFAVLLFLQGLSLTIRSVLVLAKKPWR